MAFPFLSEIYKSLPLYPISFENVVQFPQVSGAGGEEGEVATPSEEFKSLATLHVLPLPCIKGNPPPSI